MDKVLSHVRWPAAAELRYNYIWRVVAPPGDKVEAFGESLTLNDQPVQRQRVSEADGSTVFREQLGDATFGVAFDTSPRLISPDIGFSSIIGRKL